MATGAGWALFADRGSVKIAWSEEGKERAMQLPAHDTAALAAAIESARTSGSGVRVSAETATVEGDVAAETAREATGERAAR